ncbi:hypothetical protein [[Flexibacter] sp. ATCC 35208]|uniref:hypothetical protein n=1 Tax=[Flexibacter] sp. ATCC 35208 TaxID=1936242 RepID=UPI0009D3628F|nr:hypothetical protein [[Flexibacter] sp. ATCC 35208]OMP74565.1 hypothetical protein BW716_34710 [[Flexibacter] sp. ATCC 35208]
MQIINLVIEKTENKFFGRIKFEDNLIVDDANDVQTLEKNMKNLLKEFHDLNPADIRFEYKYDFSALFENFSFLNVAAIAEMSGMNVSLLRQYKNKVKFPSARQAKKIEDTIHQIGRTLIDVHILSK